MGVLDFLFPFLMAADSHAKTNKYKHRKQVIDDINRGVQISQELHKYLEENYTDINAEMDMIPMTDKEYLNLYKKLPSYNADEDWDVLTEDRYGVTAKELRRRISLARKGLLLVHDKAFFKMGYEIFGERGVWWGRERYDYRGQICHELMVEWEREMRANGFPYNLYVYDKLAESNNKLRYRSTSVLARETSYKWGTVYYWK